MQPQKTSTTGGGTLHNIAEKIKHPFTHDTDTNVTYQTREQKKLAETDPHLAGELGAKDVGVPPVTTNPLSSSRTTTTVPTKDAMLNQSSVPSTHSTIAREEYHEKKWMMSSSEEYLALKKNKIATEDERPLIAPLNLNNINRTFAPSSKHLHLHNITTENIKHSLCNKSKSKPIVLSRNNENTFSTIIQSRKEPNHQQIQQPTTSQIKPNQKDGSVSLDELQETEVKNIFKRYFPRGTKVSHARCGCGYLHPYISLPTDSNGNVTLENDLNKSNKTPNPHHNSTKIVIRRNLSTPTTEPSFNSRGTSSNSPFFYHSERRSKPFDLVIGSSNISQNPVHIEIPNMNEEEDFSDEEELTKLLNFTSNITPNKLTSPSTNADDSLQELPSKDFFDDEIVNINEEVEKEDEKIYNIVEKCSKLKEKVREMENELKSREEQLSIVEEDNREKLKELENELRLKEEKINDLEEEKTQFENEKISFEEKINDLNDKIVELVYCVPPIPQMNSSFSSTDPMNVKEEGIQVDKQSITKEESVQYEHSILNITNDGSTNTEGLDVKEVCIQVTAPTNEVPIQANTETSETSTNTDSIQKIVLVDTTVQCTITKEEKQHEVDIELLKERDEQIQQLLTKLGEKEEEVEKLVTENQTLLEERDFISQNVSYGIDANKKVLELLEKELERIKNEMQLQSDDFARERKILENEIETLQNQDTKNQEATNNKISDLEKELNEARTVIELMTAEANKSNEVSSNLTKDLEDIQAQKQSIEEELDAERKRYEELLETLQERIEEDDNNKKVIANTSQQVKLMNSELEALTKMLEEKQEIVEDLEEKLTESQQNVEELLSNKQEETDTNQEQLYEQSAQIDSLLEEIKDKEDEIVALQSELSQCEKKLIGVEEKLQDKEKQLCKEITQMGREIDVLKDALNGKSESENEQINRLEERNATLEDDLNVKEEELNQLVERAKLEKEIFDEERIKLEEQLDQYSNDIDQKKSMLNDLEKENAEIKSLLDIKESTIDEYTSRLEELDEENTKLRNQMKSLENDLETLQNENKELQNQLISGDDELHTKLESSLDDCERYKALMEESKQEIETLNTEIQGLRSQIEDCNLIIDNLKNETKSQEETEDLLNQIDQLKKSIDGKEEIISEKEKEIEKSQDDLERFMDNYNNYKERAEMEIAHFQEQISSSFNELQEKNDMISNLQHLLEKQQLEHDREMQNADQVLKSLQERLANTAEEIEKLTKEKESLEKSMMAKSQNSAVESRELNDLRRENYELKRQFEENRQSNDKMQQEVERLLEQLTKGGGTSAPSSVEGSPEMISKTPTHRNGKFSAIIQTSTPMSYMTTVDLWKQLRAEILRLKQKNVELAQQIMQVNKTKEETISKYEKELRKVQMDISKYRKIEVDFERQKTQLMQVEEYGRKLEENNNLLNNHLKQLEYEKTNLLRLQEQTRSELQQLKDNLETLTAENQRLIKAEKKRNLGDRVSPPPSLLPANNSISNKKK